MSLHIAERSDALVRVADERINRIAQRKRSGPNAEVGTETAVNADSFAPF